MKTGIKTWFPTHRQLVLTDIEHNSRFYSLFVGLTAPIFNLPAILWTMIVMPLIDGVMGVFRVFIISFIGGFRGHAMGLIIQEDEEAEVENGK